MYNVYLISMPDHIPIHHVMHVEYGNKALLLLLATQYAILSHHRSDLTHHTITVTQHYINTVIIVTHYLVLVLNHKDISVRIAGLYI